jgi:hypothetical protein
MITDPAHDHRVHLLAAKIRQWQLDTGDSAPLPQM